MAVTRIVANLAAPADDLDATEAAVRTSGALIVYGPVAEVWGLRRFFFRDPAGHLVNVVDS